MTQTAGRHHEHVQALAELVVAFGANLQSGQILAISSEPGKEDLARAIAESAYRRGALFVDLSVFDVHLKRSRALHADPETLRFIPPWMGARARALGEHHCARIALTGPAAPRVLEGIDPALLGRDTLPSLPESMQIIDDRTTNWTAVPCPTLDWAQLVHPELGAARRSTGCGATSSTSAAWTSPIRSPPGINRLDDLGAKSATLDALGLDALHFEGPGTDLTVGLLPSSHWCAARFETVDGIVHAPNIPTEEVFTTPDPERVHGFVTATKPLFTSGTTVTGLQVRFEDGRAVAVEADHGAELIRGLTEHDEGAARLGEVALVDREGRIGPLDTVFYDTLIDENAASHIALGQGYELGVRDPDDLPRVNQSSIHVDFMIGGDEVSVTGRRRDGTEVALLRDGSWQI